MAVTPNYGWPVPVATDYVKDGYAAIADLGDAIDATVFGLPAGGLALINTTSFSAVSSQSINSVFSSTYKNYVINFNITTSGVTNVNFRLRSGSTDSSTALYGYGVFRKDMSAATLASDAQAVTATSWPVAFNDNDFDFQTKLFNPFGTAVTKFDSGNASNPGGMQVYYFGGLYDATTSYNGFTFFPATGTMTGSVSVYGYSI